MGVIAYHFERVDVHYWLSAIGYQPEGLNSRRYCVNDLPHVGNGQSQINDSNRVINRIAAGVNGNNAVGGRHLEAVGFQARLGPELVQYRGRNDRVGSQTDWLKVIFRCGGSNDQGAVLRTDQFAAHNSFSEFDSGYSGDDGVF
jgi:hypothetical protein